VLIKYDFTRHGVTPLLASSPFPEESGHRLFITDRVFQRKQIAKRIFLLPIQNAGVEINTSRCFVVQQSKGNLVSSRKPIEGIEAMLNRNWVFGSGASLDFSTNPPTATAIAGFTTFEGCASISDSSGTLILYTDGQSVWDGAGAIRVTSGLNGNQSSTQSAIIVPNPGKSSEYYIFTADGASGANNHVASYLVDTSASTWTATLQTLPPANNFSSTEKVTAIQHANCKDFWVITVIQQSPSQADIPSGSGTFRVFLINSTGVTFVGDTPMNRTVHDLGYLKGSPDGSRIAVANWEGSSTSTAGNVLLAPFNNATGVVDVAGISEIQVPKIKGHVRKVYGVEFSPSCDILYYSVLGSNGSNQNNPAENGYIYQYKISAGTTFPVGSHKNYGEAGRYALGSLQLGMDNRIYIAQDGEAYLGIIASPDVIGSGCGLQFGSANTGITLDSSTKCYMGLPNMVSNFCSCSCEGDNCHEAVLDANTALNKRADGKSFIVIANGQTVPASCDLAFDRTDFSPIFSFHWGDGPSDQLEDEDIEVVYISVRNPFRNLVFRGLKIFNIRVSPNQVLPNGEDALQLIPTEIACFDEIGPCSHISRDFAFLIKNAVPQNYQITFDYCIEEMTLTASNDGSASFNINVVAS
jgi:hypothetical protein